MPIGKNPCDLCREYEDLAHAQRMLPMIEDEMQRIATEGGEAMRDQHGFLTFAVCFLRWDELLDRLRHAVKTIARYN